jgi:hypothetical protein
MPDVSLRNVPTGADVEIVCGDTLVLMFLRLGDISGRDKLWFTLKADRSDDADSASLIQIEETAGLEYIDGAAATVPGNGTITVIDAPSGDITVGLAAVEAAKLDDDTGHLSYDVQMLAGTTITTLVMGGAVIVADATKATS